MNWTAFNTTETSWFGYLGIIEREDGIYYPSWGTNRESSWKHGLGGPDLSEAKKWMEKRLRKAGVQ